MTQLFDQNYQLLSEARTGDHEYSIAYEYDEVGNRTRREENGAITEYTYDDANQLLLAQPVSGTSAPLPAPRPYEYSADGLRRAKTVGGEVGYFRDAENCDRTAG